MKYGIRSSESGLKASLRARERDNSCDPAAAAAPQQITLTPSHSHSLAKRYMEGAERGWERA